MGHYDLSLVILSVVIAITASFASLNLIRRLPHEWGNKHWGWLAAAAATLGLGIWTMHFVGMLAHHMSVPVQYDAQLTIISLILAVSSSGLALFITDRYSHGFWFWVAGLAMGLGIASMHYVGMEAMRMTAYIEYSTSLVILSVVIAIAASIVALWLGMGKPDREKHNFSFLVLASIGMGMAISSMHYIGMEAANFIPVTHNGELTGVAINASGLATIGGSVILIALVAVAWFAVRDERIGSSISSRVSWLAFSMIIISAITVGAFFYQHTTDSLIQRDYEKLSHEVDVEEAELRAIINTLRNDVRFLSRTPPVKGIIRSYLAGGIDPLDGSTDEDWHQRLAAIFNAFLQSKPDYLHSRFIHLEKNIIELVGADRQSNNLILIQQSQLPLESKKEYWDKVALLKKGDVYLSDVSLERHNGKIIQPPQAIMQAASPVFSDDNNLFGIITITVNFNEVLKELAEEREPGDSDFVINSSGDFLASRNPEKDFAFETGKPWHIQDEYPELTQFILDINQKSITQEIKIPGDTLILHLNKVYFDIENPTRFIGIAEGFPYSKMLSNTQATVNRVVIMTLVLIIIATSFTFIMSRRILRPLTDMTLAAQQFARGDLNITLKNDGRGELGVLSRAFSSMMTQVDERGDQLRRSEKFVKTVLDTAADAIMTIVYTEDGCSIRSANAEAVNIFAYSLDQLINMKLEKIIDIEKGVSSCSFIEARLNSLTKNDTAINNINDEATGIRNQGEKFPMEIKITEIGLEQQRVFVLLIRDITIKKQIENELKMAASVMHSALEGVVITDKDNQIIAVNPAFTSITGYTSEEVIGKNPRILSSGQHDLKFYIEMWRSIFSSDSWQGEIWDRRKNGEVFPKWMSISVIRDSYGGINNYIAIFSDITERKITEKRLHQLAHYDPLTQLPNRLLFADRLSQSIAQAERHGKRLALMFLDLDHFKLINDTLGHDLGDELLKQVSARISDSVRESDTVARIAGDEFTIILPDITNTYDADSVAAKIVSILAEPFVLNNKERFTGVSIGISLYPDDADNVDELIKYADVAMYRAKAQGRNNYQQYQKVMSEGVSRRLELETQLRGALERDEFRIYYQPQVDLNSGKIIGVEALLRWFTDKNTIISPVEFIPIAEETGLIRTIGEWVIERACIQLNKWSSEGLSHLRIAVNVSSQQFSDNNMHFPDMVKAYLHQYKIDASKIEFELTESAMLDHPEHTVEVFEELSKMGIHLAMDDFGTGYSSLSQLRLLPFDTIKIDKSFVCDITENPDDEDLARSIVAISKTLKRIVLAEGVETKDQLDSIIEMGCDVAQGYYFSKPLPIDKIEILLNKNESMI